jgi:hypothetical protein
MDKGTAYLSPEITATGMLSLYLPLVNSATTLSQKSVLRTMALSVRYPRLQ